MAEAASRVRDPEETREQLATWFRDAHGARDVSVSLLSGPVDTGYSHETLIFDVRWDDERERSLVARVKPSTHTVFPDDRFELEYRVARALGSAEGILVPAVRWYEDDPRFLGAPFFVMDRVDGLIPGDNPPYTFGGWLAEATPQQQAKAWWTGLEAMAAVHRLNWRALELDFVSRDEFAYWEEYGRWATERTPLPIANRGLEWLRANRPAAVDEPALCWGDSRPGNQIFRDFECVALLDWEMAAIDDPEMDLGWWLYFDRLFSEGLQAPRPAGFPPHEESVARWEELTGRRARNLRFWEIFAAYRFAVVLLRVSELMMLTERMPSDSDFPVNNFATQMLARVMAEVGAEAVTT